MEATPADIFVNDQNNASAENAKSAPRSASQPTARSGTRNPPRSENSATGASKTAAPKKRQNIIESTGKPARISRTPKSGFVPYATAESIPKNIPKNLDIAAPYSTADRAKDFKT